jgi:hypothetical protein
MRTPKCTILQAACATIASYEVYKPVVLGKGSEEVIYNDATVGYANPTNEAFKEAERLFGKEGIVATILSVGAGKPELRPSEANEESDGLNSLLKRVITDTERIHNDIQSRFRELGIYFRFNVERIHPIDKDSGRATKAHTTEYLKEEIINQKLDEAVTSINERKGVKALRDISMLSHFVVRILSDSHFRLYCEHRAYI